MEIIKIRIEDLKPYEKNAKIHTQEQIEQIKESIEQFGMNDPIAVWGKDNIIIEGHGRLEALKQLGYNEVECIRLDHLTNDERKAYTLAHNKLTMNTGFDFDILEEELSSIEGIDMSDFGFDIGKVVEPEEVKEDDFEVALPKEPKSKQGEIYQLGRHRLMCGDSTSQKDVEKLMNGKTADLLLTDPPYNVAITNSQGMTIENDNMDSSAFYEFLDEAFQNANNSLKAGGAFYVWYASREHINFVNSLKANSLFVKEQLIWVNNSFTFGRQDYKWKHEPCLYGWKEGASHYFVEEYNHPTVIEDELDIDNMKKEDMKKLLEEMLSEKVATTVIHENKPLKNDLHPTMKPLKICGDLIRHSSKPEEIVLDLFGGSGSTLMACEQLNRTCYMMEYDPQYLDVIIERWETFTGEKAVKISD